jgi:D-alanyl-D-alanine carboxypeptidase
VICNAFKALLLAVLVTAVAGGVVGGPTPEEALATAGGGGSPAATGPAAGVTARAWTLIDARTGETLTSHAAARPLPVASTTKLMTAYVALHDLPLGRIVRAAPYHPTYGESLLGLRRGQRISVRDLLYGLILRSGNDAAYDLARAAAGSEAGFVREMNLHAAALGLADTHYANPIGLDQRGNHSSARDLATLTRRLLRIPLFAKVAASRHAVLRSLDPPRRIASVNALLRMAPWVNGVKTGHTLGAGFVLVGAGRRKGVELIAVVIGAPTDDDRFADALNLLDYGFAQYPRPTPIRAGEEIAVPVTSLRAGPAITRTSAFDRAGNYAADRSIPIGVGAFVILIGAALLWRRWRRRTEGEETIRVSREERQGESRQSGDGGVAQ